MGALLPFTTTLLQLRGDRSISQENRRGIDRASLRISCRNPASTSVENAAEVRNRESLAKREQHLASQGSEDTHQSRPRATKTEVMTESEWEVYCDILPDSYQRLHLKSSWQACETEVEASEASELMEFGSKKQLRLSFVSWDLLD